ncbi:MAG: DUF368 domain-containing protein [Myxococcales bacterium]|nr:DUF368 domain-containing protein [Myxococcales bacterium]MCB9733466.1 DUF368 domain-containing protein [Deltaproteobacteria bacterium]
MVSWLVNSLRGICMGTADAIPGVSGGTIALVLGIYERFIGAISAVGLGLVKAVFTRAFWRRLWAGLKDPAALGDAPVDVHAKNVLFLGSLVVGIALALAVGAKVIPDLLATYPSQMHGFFLGLVLASVMVPWRMMKKRQAPQMVALVLGAVATFFVVGLPLDQSQSARGVVTVELPAPAAEAMTLTAAEEKVVFLTQRYGGEHDKREVGFLPAKPIEVAAGQTTVEVPVLARLAGKVGNLDAGQIAAVRGLPEGTTVRQAAATEGGSDPALWFVFVAGVIAISAMVLPGISGAFLLLMLGMYHYILFNLRLVLYERDGGAMVVVGVFLAAVVIGILSFSRFLSWLLARYHDTTIAALIGIMIGSVRKLWPFETLDADGVAHPSLPSGFDGTVAATLIALVVGAVIVVGLDRWARTKKHHDGIATIA